MPHLLSLDSTSTDFVGTVRAVHRRVVPNDESCPDDWLV